jgi:hypothetical protein
MILTDKNNKGIVIRCSYGTETICFDKDDEEYFLSILIDAFYSEQDGFFDRLKKRIKTAWYIFRKGTYQFQEIVLTEDDMKDLKEVINKF